MQPALRHHLHALVTSFDCGPHGPTALPVLLQAVPLANMVLETLERPEQSVADAALEYVSCLDYVAMTERDSQLQV